MFFTETDRQINDLMRQMLKEKAKWVVENDQRGILMTTKEPLDTGDKEAVLGLLTELRKAVDTIGGTDEANALRHALDDRLTDCYCMLVGSKPLVTFKNYY